MEGNALQIRYTKEDEQLERELVAQFVCPGCEKYMFPPIRQCRTGHNFCSDCFYNMKRCIVCSMPKSEIRSHVLEKLQGYLRFPCKYHKVGCNFCGTGPTVQVHQNDCEYSKFVCPLGFTKCTWCDRLTVLQGRPRKIWMEHLPPRAPRFKKHRPHYRP